MSFFYLLYLNLKLSILRLLQQIIITPLYFKYPLFKVDLLYFSKYWNKNPYRMCKKFFMKTENKEVFYGDSWPLSIYFFTKALPITKDDVVYEMGSGIGRSSFWIQQITRCKVLGIDKVSSFIKHAQSIQKSLKNSKIQFLEEDFLNIDYQPASIIYFYSSTFSSAMLQKLIQKWKSLKKGTKIITTSFSLLDYGATDYQILSTYKVSYPWGVCDVYVHEKES